ncbi:hypothetical protein D3C72_1654360 [compost metagenome]
MWQVHAFRRHCLATCEPLCTRSNFRCIVAHRACILTRATGRCWGASKSAVAYQPGRGDLANWGADGGLRALRWHGSRDVCSDFEGDFGMVHGVAPSRTGSLSFLVRLRGAVHEGKPIVARSAAVFDAWRVLQESDRHTVTGVGACFRYSGASPCHDSVLHRTERRRRT